MDEDPDIGTLIADLTLELRRVSREFERDSPRGFPTREKLSRLTSEVAIPGLILWLQTQIRVLQLLQRAIRIADGRTSGETSEAGREVRQRAEQLGQATLTQLDTLLRELQAAVEGESANERTQELIDNARELQEQLQDELAADPDDRGVESESGDLVDIDVESELESLKDDLDDVDEDDQDGNDGNNSDAGKYGDN